MKLKQNKSPATKSGDGKTYDYTKKEGQRRRYNELPSSSSTPIDKYFTYDTNGAENRKTIISRHKCPCWVCLDSGIRYNYEILQQEIKSTQKSIAHCKEDTNKILGKIAELETILKQ